MPETQENTPITKEKRLELFAKEYALDFNGTRAAKAVGINEKWAAATASWFLRNPKVQKYLSKLIERRASKLDLSIDKIVHELTLMGFSNMGDYISIVDGDPRIDLSNLTREQAAAIQEVTIDEYLEGKGKNARPVKKVKLKLVDKTKNLELLGRYLAMFHEEKPQGNTFTLNILSTDAVASANRFLDDIKALDVQCREIEE